MVKIVVFERGVGHFEHKFQREWGIAQQQLSASENYSHWAITWCCFRDRTFSHSGAIPAYDRQTDEHKMTASTMLG